MSIPDGLSKTSISIHIKNGPVLLPVLLHELFSWEAAYKQAASFKKFGKTVVKITGDQTIEGEELERILRDYGA